MKIDLRYCFLVFILFIAALGKAQIANNCANATQVCNNQLAEQLDDGFGTQECPTGGCGCMLVGEKNTRWFKIVVQTAGTLEFTLSPYNGSADYDFSVWNMGPGGSCPSSGSLPSLGNPTRCNYASPQSPTGIRGAGNGNSNTATGNLFSNSMAVAAGDVIYILVDNWDGTNVGFRLDFFGGTAGSGTGTTATFSCSGINTCSTCSDPDCQTYRFDSPTDYSFAETAANGGCHSPFGYSSVKTATVCGTFLVPSPFTTVEFPMDKGYEITTTNGANTTTCLNSAAISYTVWGTCGVPLSPVTAGTGIYTVDNVTTYKVCKTVTVSGTDCWLSRICLPYWTMVQNDEPCGAIALTVNAAAIAGTNSGATAGIDAGCTAYQDVFYKFTAPASGRIQVNVVPNASSDVKVSLLGPQAGLTGGVNDCNQSCSQMTNVAAGCNDNAGTAGTERLFSFVIPGQTYYVWISGTQARRTATFTIQVTETITNTAVPTPGSQLVGSPDAIPTNDACANAKDLSPMCNIVGGTTIGATADCTDPDPQYVDAITLENDVWYKWTAPANNGNSQVTLEVTGISCTDGAGVGATGIQFGVFYGSCASLTPVSHGTTTLTFTAVSGRTYYFVIDGNAGAQCNFNVNIKRPTITSQTCVGGGNYCAGSSLSASFNYSYYGTNPGYKWAYCKSSTFGTACNSLDLDNPATYSVYDPTVGLPNPGCTPATYTFIGYILADNGATTIATGYPTPQPAGANCVRSTNACTFNIYPDIKNAVTVTKTACSQVVTANAGCASSIVITGNANQTIASPPGGTGTFSAVTVTWNATYAGTAPAACKTYTIQNTYACLGASGANTCSSAPQLIVGGSTISTNNNVTIDAEEQLFTSDGLFFHPCTNSAGYGVWFTFVAPNSGKATISLTNVGTGDDLDAVFFLFDSRQVYPAYKDCDLDFTFQSDVCASCADLEGDFCNLLDQYDYNGCMDANSVNLNESGSFSGLNPGETYYIMVDGYFWSNAFSSRRTGNFTIGVTDPGGGPTRPGNDNCTGAVDISSIGCALFPGSNINASSQCGSDLTIPGATTENSVWYTYTPTVTGSHIIQYKWATGTFCAGIGIQPGVQFAMYTSSDNSCTGTFTNIPAATVSTGTINGSITVNLTAGQKYYILIDGYGGNICDFLFQVYNGNTCCTANLGSTEGSDKVLCFGDDVTYGVSANPIDFGSNVQSNPVIAWQLSTSQPSNNDPLNILNIGKSYLIGKVDTLSSGTTISKVYRDVQGNFPAFDPNDSQKPGYDVITNNQKYYPVTISGFPSGATFDATTDTISLCIHTFNWYFSDLVLELIAPNGTKFSILLNACTNKMGYVDVCFTNKTTSGTPPNISSILPASCPAAGVIGEITGFYLPLGAWAGLNSVPINGTWQVRVRDSLNNTSANNTEFYGYSLDIKKPYTTTGVPTVNTAHGDLHIVNNDPYKYGSQVFWLTPVTAVNYSSGTLTFDSVCYSYGAPVKVTMLEKMTTPAYVPSCISPFDGSAGVGIKVTSPDGGWPSLTPAPTPAQYFIVTGTGAASAISFPSPPVGISEQSNSFTVANGQAWGVTFTDSNGCKSNISGTFDKPNVGSLVMDTTVCKGDSIQYSVTIPPPLYSKYQVTIDFDSYPQDISWVIYDGSNNIVESGGGYAGTLGAVTYITALIDPNKGPYRIEFFDGYGDGLGSGGGSTTGGGSSSSNFIKIEELNSTGGSTVIFNQTYAYCSPVYCTGPAASLFSDMNIALGTPTGTYVSGVTNNLYSGTSCAGAPITLGVIPGTNSSGTVNTNAPGVTAGATYSVKYSFTDQYGCITSLCQPVKVFPKISITPTINCVPNPAIVSSNGSCPSCNATYVAEYSYDGGTTWTTSTTGTFQDIFTYARVRNIATGEAACEVSSAKLGDCPNILPIELIYIKAIPVDNQYIKVTWATATELNSNRFEVLRSTDAINFVKIGEVQAAGNSNVTRTYSFDDHDVVGGVIYYYQVREVDNDSRAQLTNIVNAKLDKDKFELISIYPNPTIENTTITMYTKDVMDITLTVYNDIGELMRTEEKRLKEGMNQWTISTETWAKGVYYFILKNDLKPITKQVIKLQ